MKHTVKLTTHSYSNCYPSNPFLDFYRLEARRPGKLSICPEFIKDMLGNNPHAITLDVSDVNPNEEGWKELNLNFGYITVDGVETKHVMHTAVRCAMEEANLMLPIWIKIQVDNS